MLARLPYHRQRSFYPAITAFAVTIVATSAAGSLYRAYGDVWVNQAATSRYIYLVGYLLAFGVAAAGPKIVHTRWLIPVAVVASALNIIVLAIALPGYP